MRITILSIITLLLISIGHAQTVNQLDANGERHGVWKKNYEGTNILRYEGEFFHGKEIGEFKFYKKYQNKAILSATKLFNKDNQIAEVTFLASNGKVISQGKMNGKKHIGKWVYYHNNSNQIMTLEHYNDNGLLDGESVVYYADGQIAEKRHYNKGLLEGEAKWYSEKGTLIKSYIYVNNELHGEAKFYDETGKLILKGRYKRDKKDGVWTHYKDGKVSEEKDYTIRSKNPYKKK